MSQSVAKSNAQRVAEKRSERPDKGYGPEGADWRGRWIDKASGMTVYPSADVWHELRSCLKQARLHTEDPALQAVITPLEAVVNMAPGRQAAVVCDRCKKSNGQVRAVITREGDELVVHAACMKSGDGIQ